MERRLKKREELKMQLPSWWTAEEITPTSEEHAAVDWDYDLDYAEHATQHAAEHATHYSIVVGHATHGNVTQSATRLAQLNATAVHYNKNTGKQISISVSQDLVSQDLVSQQI